MKKKITKKSAGVQKKSFRPWLVGAGLMTGGTVACVAAFGHTPDGTVAAGISVSGLKIGGKSIDQARSELTEWSTGELVREIALTVSLGGEHQLTYRPTRADIGASLDLDHVIRDTEQIAKDRSPLQHALAWFGAKNEVNVGATWKVDPLISKAWLKKNVASDVYQEMKSARLVVKGDSSVEVKPEIRGRVLNIGESVKIIESAITGQSTVAVLLPVKEIIPHVTSADLSDIQGEVSRFQTHYGETGNRARNILTACNKINGTVLKPCDIFSYNRTVGPREESAGFKMAPVIIRGKLEPGMGGGVCQTSSTLYNAVLMAGLKVVRRSHHAFPVHYVPSGRDATVAYGSIDFQFQNDMTHTIAVVADGSNGRVSMRIFGTKVIGRSVVLNRKPIKDWEQSEQIVPAKDLAAGKRRVADSGHPGIHVALHRQILQDGSVVKDEKISDDTYEAFPRIIEVGSTPTKKPVQVSLARIPVPKPVQAPITRP